MKRIRLAVRFACCVLLMSAASGLVHALPRGYREDFNGCATQSADEADRKRCCMETFKQCSDQCQRDFADKGDYNGAINCGSDCLWAHEKCKDGQTVRVVGWPGMSGDVPGLLTDGDHLVPDNGRDLVASTSAVLVELRGQGELATEACAAFVVACQCPPGTARDQECRARMEGKGTACQICRRGSSADGCKPCPGCRPELLSAQPCSAGVSAPRRSGATKQENKP